MRRVLLLAAMTSFCLLSLNGCAAVRNPFFVMSSDSPNPFFGAELTLPPKFGNKK